MANANRLWAIALLIAAACSETDRPIPDAGMKNDLGFEPFDGAIRLDSGVPLDASEDAGDDGGVEDANGADAAPDAGPENQRGDLIVSELQASAGNGSSWKTRRGPSSG